MFILCLALTIVFGVMLIVGFAWGLAERGKTTKRSGSEVGAELMAERMAGDAAKAGKMPVVRKAFFRGKGIAVEREAEYSYAEIKQRFREGGVRQVIPALLGMTGMLGLTFFLSLTLLTGLSNKIYGLVVLAFCGYCVYLLIAGFMREG